MARGKDSVKDGIWGGTGDAEEDVPPLPVLAGCQVLGEGSPRPFRGEEGGPGKGPVVAARLIQRARGPHRPGNCSSS